MLTKFQVACPKCKEMVEYNILGRDYDHKQCPHCKTIFEVQMRYLIPVISLLLFFFCYQVYALGLKVYLALWMMLLIGVSISLFMTLVIAQQLAKRFGSSLCFETMIKEKKV